MILTVIKACKDTTLVELLELLSGDRVNPSGVLRQVALLPSTSVSPFEVIPLGAGTISGAAPATDTRADSTHSGS